MTSADIQIPNRSLFRQPEVCEIAQVQPYVLRSWEAEFPDLGVTKSQGGTRVYRKADLERVLRIKHLLFVEGLTLAGVRRKLQEEQGAPRSESAAVLDELLASDVRERILNLRASLRELAIMLGQTPLAERPGNGEFHLAAPLVRKEPTKHARSTVRPTKPSARPAKHK